MKNESIKKGMPLGMTEARRCKKIRVKIMVARETCYGLDEKIIRQIHKTGVIRTVV
jgi:hypothetical protein